MAAIAASRPISCQVGAEVVPTMSAASWNVRAATSQRANRKPHRAALDPADAPGEGHAQHPDDRLERADRDGGDGDGLGEPGDVLGVGS